MSITISEFLRAVYGELEGDEFGWVTFFSESPASAPADVWTGRMYKHAPVLQSMMDRQLEVNAYFCPAVLRAAPGEKAMRRKASVAFPVLLAVDDAAVHELRAPVTYVIETSPGKFQVACKLDRSDPDVHDLQLFDRVLQLLVARGAVHADRSGNNIARYLRVPGGRNTKYSEPWDVQLRQWNPEVEYSLADACAAFGIDLEEARSSVPVQSSKQTSSGEGSDWRELISQFTHPDPKQRSYHSPITSFTAKLTAAGASEGAVVNVTRALMELTRPEGDAAELERWETRWNEVPRAVSGAQKFLPPATPSAVINIPGLDNPLFMRTEQLAIASANVRWLVKGLVPADSMGILFGASGTYKSFVALDMGLHVAHGMEWCGRRTRPGQVLYCAAEGGAGISRRVQAWHQEHGLEPSDMFRVCIETLVLSQQVYLQKLIAAIDQLQTPPALVIIDTLSQSSNIDENDATEVAEFLRGLNTQLRARYNCTVVLVHHTGHVATERPRGSSVLTANMDWLLSCVRPDAQAQSCMVETVKQKDGDKLPPLMFDLRRQVLGFDEDGDEVSSLVAAHNGATGAFVAGVRASWGKHEKALWEALESPRSEAELKQLFLSTCATQEAARKAYSRALGTLEKQRLVLKLVDGTVKRKGAS